MIKSQSVLGKGGQRDMAEAFCRRTGAQLQDKPGDFLTVRFDSRGVSLSGLRADLSGGFCGDDASQSYQRQTSA